VTRSGDETAKAKNTHLLLLLLGVGALAGAIALIVLWTQTDDPVAYLKSLPGMIQAFLQSVPAPIYWLAFAVLPVFGVPLTVFYLTALPILGVNGLGWGLLGAYSALLTNMALAYALGRYLLRPWLEPLLQARGWAIPQTSPGQQTKVIVVTRLSPVPYVFQNYALSVAGFGFGRYLGWSILTQGLIGLGMMLLGEAFLAGGFKYALPAVFLIVVAWVGLPWLRQRLGKKGVGDA